jgi:hypothetical protein
LELKEAWIGGIDFGKGGLERSVGLCAFGSG